MHMGHVALRVDDLTACTEYFKRTLGLREVRRDDAEVLLSANEKHHELQLIASDTVGMDHIGLEVESTNELDEVRDRALRAGARLIEDPPAEDGLGERIRFVGPADMVYEVYTDMQRAPLDPASFLKDGIRRFGHLTFLCEDHAAVLAFWLDGLGFRVSDEFEGIVWARCDADHHALAVGPAPEGSHLHHHAWEVQDLGALGQYCDDVARDGNALIWGPVRHGPGFNISTYLPDPCGAVIEVYTDLLRIDDEASYEQVDWSKVPGALNLWGPPPGPGFMEAGTPVLPAASGQPA